MGAVASAVLNALAGAALVWYVVIWLIGLLGLHVARTLYGESWPRSPLSAILAGPRPHDGRSTARERGPDSSEAPSVSILRPLAGLDCNLYTNLSSSFEQQYPADRVEIILSVMSEKDDALMVAEKVRQRYPHIDSRIIVGMCS